jgi:hypothetical protein
MTEEQLDNLRHLIQQEIDCNPNRRHGTWCLGMGRQTTRGRMARV